MKLLKWVKYFDHFNDLPYWEHKITHKTRWDEPKLEEFVSTVCSNLEPPDHLPDISTGKLLFPRTTRISEMSSPEISEDDVDDDPECSKNSIGNNNSANASTDRFISRFHSQEIEAMAAANRLLSKRRCLIRNARNNIPLINEKQI